MKDEAQLHFERAADCIEDSQILFIADRLAAVVTRVYYAMFHAATAVLLEHDIKRSSHSGVISALGESFVATGKLAVEHHRYFRDAFDLRQQGDYEPQFDINKKEA